ncbi:pyruvate dehydrogenase E1 component alpha subunit [Brevibacterium sanguinis]|uniref:Pyruvate dehydrogenase E1 component alpha subunit n=2 Tax=Brevibacterium TaxID=1696 RepID=A0A366IJM2_9MICO|nr:MULTISPECIES: pyruvate dehydrogenase (acetyl-transferring) E1 component subunit alpha [Brevibacterium]RBP65076.1 pyruvate dehydrogenase E1 component alpha subunit [Brevibacterium sanguinis]RBP71339.1 pyruvate dehydrogenase E1 component alpha subunit [Brevibacterium celere]
MSIDVPTTGRALPELHPVRFIGANGEPADTPTEGLTPPSPSTLLGLYRQMVLVRRFEAQVTALTKQGRLATYPSAAGQEATEVGATTALGPTDWLFPTYRDSAALLTRGIPVAEILAAFRGDWHCGFNPYEYHTAPAATPLATQTLHATGFAMASKLKGRGECTLTIFGDGASSEGDAHEALNFASVWQTPTVFVLQNNQYAISTPLREQSNATLLADRAAGYGIPGLRVDGNDVSAVFAAVSAALERARAGEGPTLIECLTYRIESHTNSDDPTRYRDSAEVDHWKRFDPISRVEKYLRSRGVLDDAGNEEILDSAEALASSVREAMSTPPDIDPTELFDHVYAKPRHSLGEQRRRLEAELAQAGRR